MQATLNDYLLDKARNSLTIFMIHEAEKLRRNLGFGYVESADAPNDYEGLRAAWDVSMRTKAALPVYNGGSERTIYTMSEGNYAFRFVHDAAHVMLQANFSPAGEARVFQYLGNKVKKAFGADSMEYKLYAADTIGQVAYYAVHRDYVGDQLAFARAMLQAH